VEELPVAEAPPEEKVPPLVEEVPEVEAPPVEEIPVAEAPPEEKAPPLVEEVPEVEAPPVEAEEPAPPSRIDELLEQLDDQPRDYKSRLEVARLYCTEQDWSAALRHYEKLVSARKRLPAVIKDLESLTEEDLDLARLYQILGDAHMHNDRLDEALEMYRLARQVLIQR
jgi:tetratricopeptide (TPR) repeat protein